MNRLIINTANDKLFIAIEKNGEVFSFETEGLVRHNESMLENVDNLLKNSGLSLENIDEFGVVIGPGSFTGIRVGIATIKAFRDALERSAKGVNNLDYLFELANSQYGQINTVAIKGSRDSYFVAKKVNGLVYKFERNLSTEELIGYAEGGKIGVFKSDEDLDCVVVQNDAKILFELLKKSEDTNLVPVYYQLSQAESEKLKRATIEICDANAQDAEKIHEIEEGNISTNVLTVADIEDCITKEYNKTFVAKAGEEIVGFIALQKTDEVNVVSVAVNKQWRNLGVGSMLLSKAEEWAKERDVEALNLEVSERNVSAFLLYKKFGFVERRIRKNYYADGANCIEMVKKI